MEHNLQTQGVKENSHKEWYSTIEFAGGVNSSPHAINQWIHRHPEFAEKYCQDISKNPARTKWLIRWDGLSVYIAQKNNYLRRSKPLSIRAFDKAKENVGIKANEAIKQSTENRQVSTIPDIDKLLQLSSNLLMALGGMNQKFVELENTVQEDRKKLVEISEKVEKQEKELRKPLPASSVHRQFLNDRVRLYAIKQLMEFPRVWRKVNEYVGRGSVQFYDFTDFQKALKFVKNLYEEAGMDWE